MVMTKPATSFRRLRTAAPVAAVIAVIVAALAGGRGPALAQEQPTGDPVNGKRIYLADGCFECHGRAGQGGAMNYQTPALAKLELPVESFVAFLRAAPNDMPAFSAAVLSDKDATDIYAFLQSLPGRQPVKNFPLLNQ
jgi:mono/diheme cytochrome c family protein